MDVFMRYDWTFFHGDFSWDTTYIFFVGDFRGSNGFPWGSGDISPSTIQWWFSKDHVEIIGQNERISGIKMGELC